MTYCFRLSNSITNGDLNLLEWDVLTQYNFWTKGNSPFLLSFRSKYSGLLELRSILKHSSFLTTISINSLSGPFEPFEPVWTMTVFSVHMYRWSNNLLRAKNYLGNVFLSYGKLKFSETFWQIMGTSGKTIFLLVGIRISGAFETIQKVQEKIWYHYFYLQNKYEN